MVGVVLLRNSSGADAVATNRGCLLFNVFSFRAEVPCKGNVRIAAEACTCQAPNKSAIGFESFKCSSPKSQRWRADHKVMAKWGKKSHHWVLFMWSCSQNLSYTLILHMTGLIKWAPTVFLDSLCMQGKQSQIDTGELSSGLHCRTKKSWLWKGISAWEQRTLWKIIVGKHTLPLQRQSKLRICHTFWDSADFVWYKEAFGFHTLTFLLAFKIKKRVIFHFLLRHNVYDTAITVSW